MSRAPFAPRVDSYSAAGSPAGAGRPRDGEDDWPLTAPRHRARSSTPTRTRAVLGVRGGSSGLVLARRNRLRPAAGKMITEEGTVRITPPLRAFAPSTRPAEAQ